MAGIIVRAEVRAHDGRTEELRAVARRLAEAGADEADTLQYRWFTTDDPRTLVAIEEYLDSAAAAAHNENCAPLLQRLFEVAELTSIQIHGELGPFLTDFIAQHPAASGFPPLSP